MKKDPGPLPLLVILTGMFAFSLLLFLYLTYSNTTIALTFYKSQMFQLMLQKPGVFFQLLGFYLAQIMTYVLFIYLLWYISQGVGDLCQLGWKNIRLLAMFLWLAGTIAILTANIYLIPHSFFSTVILANTHIKNYYPAINKTILLGALFICMTAFGLALLQMGFEMAARQHRVRHGVMAIFLLSVLGICFGHDFKTYQPAVSAATAEKPNIFIIGFDALRPDYISYFNAGRKATPNFDKFLKSAVVFEDALTPVARTFPSWVSILTAQYPLHSNAREDNIDLKLVHHNVTIAKILQSQGYQTIYASDDNRFSNVNNPAFGFDESLGADGDVVDFILNAMSDFPISNLLLTTPVGELLFPTNFANHASAHTYDPNNFLHVVNSRLQNINGKPLFFAAHFNVTAWPFYTFGTSADSPFDTSLPRYKDVIKKADTQLGKFLGLLKKAGLLDHAIFVLISDHGITLGLPHDRIISESSYQGNPADIKVKRYKYMNMVLGLGDPAKHQSDETHFISLGDESIKTDPDKLMMALLLASSGMSPSNYGIDTSWGYGSDLLSPRQNHPLLAVRTYGLPQIIPHRVTGRCLLQDIAPTLLDVLNIPSQLAKDGISLKAYLLDPALQIANNRPIFFETSFTLPEIEKENIVTASVLLKTISFWQINPKDSLVSMIPVAQAEAIKRKQRGILAGDWLLVYYPSSIRYKNVIGPQDENPKKDAQEYLQPPYQVLVNVKTGLWTMDMHNAFAATAPLQDLTSRIQAFYGAEMNNYQ